MRPRGKSIDELYMNAPFIANVMNTRGRGKREFCCRTMSSSLAGSLALLTLRDSP